MDYIGSTENLCGAKGKSCLITVSLLSLYDLGRALAPSSAAAANGVAALPVCIIQR